MANAPEIGIDVETLLALNGYDLGAPEEDFADMILDVASGKINKSVGDLGMICVIWGPH